MLFRIIVKCLHKLSWLADASHVYGKLAFFSGFIDACENRCFNSPWYDLMIWSDAYSHDVDRSCGDFVAMVCLCGMRRFNIAQI